MKQMSQIERDVLSALKPKGRPKAEGIVKKLGYAYTLDQVRHALDHLEEEGYVLSVTGWKRWPGPRYRRSAKPYP